MIRKENVTFTIEPSHQKREMIIWQPEREGKAVVQLLHGMAEHIERYDRAARALCEQGYIVAGHNHMGHGPACPAENLGYFYDQDGWGHLVEDAHYVSALLRERFPGKPLILLGHSMGSFMAREYAFRYGDELSALVLSGTGYQPALKCAAGRVVAALCPKKKPAKIVDKLAFSGNNKPFEPARTASDWLTRDEKEVDKFIADDRCGFMFTGRAYYDFFGGLIRLTDLHRFDDLPSDLPVYFMSGDRDPVGQMGKGVKRVASQFTGAGMTDITVKLYPGARHELFNETNWQEAVSDLVAWLDKKYTHMPERVMQEEQK